MRVTSTGHLTETEKDYNPNITVNQILTQMKNKSHFLTNSTQREILGITHNSGPLSFCPPDGPFCLGNY